MQESWNQWIPGNILPFQYELVSFDTTCDGGTIVLTDLNKKNNIEIGYSEFGGLIIFKKYTHHAYTKKLEYLNQLYGSSFYENWSFFTVLNSDFRAWAEAEDSFIEYIRDELTHYAIVTPTAIVDILTNRSLVIKFK